MGPIRGAARFVMRYTLGCHTRYQATGSASLPSESKARRARALNEAGQMRLRQPSKRRGGGGWGRVRRGGRVVVRRAREKEAAAPRRV